MASSAENVVEKWLCGMQGYLNSEMEKMSSVLGLCGGKPYCGYCRFEEDIKYKYVCAKAIIDYYKDKGIEIDYNNNNYAEIITSLLKGE